MTKRILTGADAMVAEWVGKRIGGIDYGGSPSTAIGLIDARGYLLAGTVYTVYTGNDVMMHVAALTPRSMTRGFVEACFLYPFGQLGCSRVTAMVARENQRSHDFVTGIGFVHEGCLREWYEDGQDAILYGMLRRECRWLQPRRTYGQPESDATGRAALAAHGAPAGRDHAPGRSDARLPGATGTNGAARSSPGGRGSAR
jgi:hypothetical protein